MKKKTIKAIFKGRDGSLGYKKDTEYTLIIKHSMCAYVEIENAKKLGEGKCQYDSVIGFLANWDNIRLA